MTNEAILALLKFSGPVIGLASALWSTTQKITYEAAEGAKRLTLQGRVMVAIILLSGLVSLLALGFESILREQQGQEAAARQDRLDRAEAEREARRREEAATTRAEIAAKAQAEALADLRRDSEQQKRFLEQRFLIAAAAAEQQRRATHISTQIAREANLRLGEAQQALAEFQRINYPLREIGATIQLKLDFTGLDPEWPLGALWEEIDLRWEASGLPNHHPNSSIFLEPDMFEKIGGRSNFHYALQGTTASLAFVAAKGTPLPRPEGTRHRMVPLAGRGTLGPTLISVTLKFNGVDAYPRTRTLIASFSGAVTLAVEGRIASGEKLSLADVVRLVPVLTIRRGGDLAYRRRPDRLGRVWFDVNGGLRFDAEPDLPIAGEMTFILFPAASP